MEILDSTVDAWNLILAETYDEDLPKACIEVLKTWETTFLPPPAIVLKECRRLCHRRMKELES